MSILRPSLIVAVTLLGACDGADVAAPIWGETMGTRYSIQFGHRLGSGERAELQTLIEADLERIDRLMSTWRDDSEISRFNADDSTGWFDVSAETARVVETALAVSRLSEGAFDVTAAPLIDLWGFGASLPTRAIPDDAEVAAAQQRVGWRLLEVRSEPPALRKLKAGVTLNLSAIAKGYAVDRLAARLSGAGVRDFLVEIGGELCTRGVNAEGQPWTIAIENPAPERAPPALVRPGYRCIATSGDYRNFFEVDGRRYAHVVDPRTGAPVAHTLASVTVVADDAMSADAWATALLVMGPEQGLALADRYDAAALMIERTPVGFDIRRTSAFAGLESGLPR